jgi:hypothetical protein
VQLIEKSRAQDSLPEYELGALIPTQDRRKSMIFPTSFKMDENMIKDWLIEREIHTTTQTRVLLCTKATDTTKHVIKVYLLREVAIDVLDASKVVS